MDSGTTLGPNDDFLLAVALDKIAHKIDCSQKNRNDSKRFVSKFDDESDDEFDDESDDDFDDEGSSVYVDGRVQLCDGRQLKERPSQYLQKLIDVLTMNLTMNLIYFEKMINGRASGDCLSLPSLSSSRLVSSSLQSHECS